MQARFCVECGANILEGQRYCTQCGTTVVTDVGFPTQDPILRNALDQAFGMALPDPGSQPLLSYDVTYPEQLSRLLIFVKPLFAIPHFVMLWLYGIAVSVIVCIAWWAILFTGRYPEGMFTFVLNYVRWQANLMAYLYLQRDEYPPFTGEPGRYPVQLNLAYPSHLSRGLIFVKWLLVLPSAFIAGILVWVAQLVALIAWFAILFTGRYPYEMFRFVGNAQRWSLRVSTYLLLLTDKYPPFSLEE